MTTLLKVCVGLHSQPVKSFLQPTLKAFIIPIQEKHYPSKPRKRFPPWFIKSTRAPVDEQITPENKAFIQEVIRERYAQPDVFGNPTPLKVPVIEPVPQWEPHYRRVGVIGKKLGIVPMWLKNGTRIITTMFQVTDNHVIKYIPPEEYSPMHTKKKNPYPGTNGSLIVGAISADPQLFTKEYCGLFADSGVMPKRLLARFHVSPAAALQPGTPLFASHFKVGQYVDIRGKTIDRGFQGVMKRWGFHGMPATHGVTKTHRRPGNIGSGGTKARVMPGQKMPGHMGNRYRILRGVQIIRINTKYNVIWVRGQGGAGETNSLVQIFDTILPLKTLEKLEQVPPFPTYFPDPDNDPLPEELFIDELHNFNDPTIMFKEE